MTSLNPQQEATIAEYTGDVVSVSRKTGEYSDESQYTGYAAIVTMSSGWTVTVGRYGAVLAEEQLPKAPTAMQVTICGRTCATSPRAASTCMRPTAPIS
jgi:hypothetical protein